MRVLRMLGRNGSALPGLLMEKLYPNFLDRVLGPVEKQVVLVTGTNGKTTTTKMLVTGLRAAGCRVITNSTGSNMTRGLIAALIEDMSYFGSLKPTDWFVFEMDEAYAPIFTKNISPRLLVGLNVLRDQLDRYGEVDTTAQLIQQTALSSDVFVYSALDPLLVSVSKIASEHKCRVVSFGVRDELTSRVANEQSTHGSAVVQSNIDVLLESVIEYDSSQHLRISSGTKRSEMQIPARGFHNALNALAVYGTLNELVHDASKLEQTLSGISAMPTPFGRGEQLYIKGKHVTVALVKNPSGFATNLTTFVKQKTPDAVLFVVNDQFADGRDVSWLWDVDFRSKMNKNITTFTSGIRAYDMALRLQHDGITPTAIETNVLHAVEQILHSNHKNIVIIPTYTALFEVRAALSRHGKVPRIW